MFPEKPAGQACLLVTKGDVVKCQDFSRTNLMCPRLSPPPQPHLTQGVFHASAETREIKGTPLNAAH